MKDYTSLFDDILFYTKELERLDNELKSETLSDTARSKLMRECDKCKTKLDQLTEKIPEISEN